MGRGIGEREGGRGPKFSFSQCPVCVATPKGHLVKGGPSYHSTGGRAAWRAMQPVPECLFPQSGALPEKRLFAQPGSGRRRTLSQDPGSLKSQEASPATSAASCLVIKQGCLVLAGHLLPLPFTCCSLFCLRWAMERWMILGVIKSYNAVLNTPKGVGGTLHLLKPPLTDDKGWFAQHAKPTSRPA